MNRQTLRTFLNEWSAKLVYLAIFLLPWQTRWLFQRPEINGAPWEYGTLGFYVVEVFILLAALGLGRPAVKRKYYELIRAGFVLLGGLFIAVAFSVSSTLSIFALLHVVAASVLFMVLLDERVDIRQAARVFVFGLVPAACLGWWHVIVGSGPASSLLGLAAKSAETLGVAVVEVGGARTLRAYGPFPHPNIFGGFLAVGLILVVWLRMQRDRRPFKDPLFWVAGLLAATLVVTFSRSAWIAASLGLVMLVFAWQRWSAGQRKGLRNTGAVIVLVGLLTAGVFAQEVSTRVLPQTRIETQSIEQRGAQMMQGREVIRERVFTGTGIGAYTAALVMLDPTQPAYAYQPIHNVFLLVLAEVGLFGMVFIAYFFWRIGERVTGLVSRRKWFAVSLFAVWLALGLFDHYLWTQWSGLALSSLIFAIIVRARFIENT
jgi:O-antigen ligase